MRAARLTALLSRLGLAGVAGSAAILVAATAGSLVAFSPAADEDAPSASPATIVAPPPASRPARAQRRPSGSDRARFVALRSPLSPAATERAHAARGRPSITTGPGDGEDDPPLPPPPPSPPPPPPPPDGPVGETTSGVTRALGRLSERTRNLRDALIPPR